MGYTIRNRHGEVQESGVSLQEAAESVMRYDGHEFEIRQGDGCLELWTSQFSRNSTLGGRPKVRSVIYSVKATRVEAETDIFLQVIQNATWWNGQDVVTDDDYAAEMAEIDAD